MSVTTINRTEQIRAGTDFAWVTNSSTGILQDTSVTASRAVATDSSGLPTASTTTATQLGYLQGLTSLTVGDVINVSSGGNLQDSGILSSNIFLADGTVAATGAFNLNSHQIHNVTDPTSAQDAATKNYVDSLANGLSWKNAVLVATTANITLSGEQTIDGFTTSSSRVLVKNQTAPAQNGIYVSNSGAWSRSSDMSTWAEVPAAAVFAQEGTINADLAFVCTSAPGGTLGTTAITFVQFGAISTYTAGNGLDLSAGVFSISTDNSLTANAGNSTPSLQVKLNASGAISTQSTGLTVNVDGTTITINGSDDLAVGTILPSNISLTTGDIIVGVAGVGAATTWTTFSASHFVIREVPSGTINGSNVTFTLATTPITGTEEVFLNGVLQESGAGNDYTISGGTITYLAAPQTGDRLLVNYQK